MNRYVGCALLLASSVALGQGTTKWVDEKGRVHYGDQPPADAKEQRITKGTTSSVGLQDGTRRSLGSVQGSARSEPYNMQKRNDAVMRRNDDILGRQREIVRANEEMQRRNMGQGNDEAVVRRNEEILRQQRETLRRNENIQHRNRVESRDSR